MLRLFLISALVLALCVALLCVRLFFGKDVRSGHVSDNQALRRRGIGCAQSQDRQARNAG